MALVLTEEQQMLRDSARDFLRERAPVSHLRALRDAGDETGFSRELYAEMAEMGWAGIVVPEAHGGLEYGYTGLGVVLEETGRTLTPSPLLSSALLSASLLRLTGRDEHQARLLPGIADGSLMVAVATEESARHDPDVIVAQATRVDQGFQINGRKLAVIDGHAADWLILSANVDGAADQLGLFVISADTDGLEVERQLLVDARSSASISLTEVVVPEDSLMAVGEAANDALAKALDLARIGQSAEMLGIAQQVFETTVAYMRDRTQFGVAIGSFQGLQHRAAHLFGEIEVLKSVVLHAMQAADREDADLASVASLAKAKASSVVILACNEAIQMHGGIGMTDDYDLGFYIKRARTLVQSLGDEYFHLDRYARLRGY